MKEAQLLRRLSHVNIVKFIEFLQTDTHYFIVMELFVTVLHCFEGLH